MPYSIGDVINNIHFDPLLIGPTGKTGKQGNGFDWRNRLYWLYR
jgi:hypothetical protein